MYAYKYIVYSKSMKYMNIKWLKDKISRLDNYIVYYKNNESIYNDNLYE